MFIVQVIPLTRLPLDKPQIYSYFTSQKVLRGSLVLVPLYQRQVKALVIDATPLSQLSKIEIRKASFELKQIIKVLTQRPILTRIQLNMIKWMAQYYYVPVGLIVKLFLPEKLTKNLKWLLGESEGNEENINKGPSELKQNYVWDDYFSRIKIYISEIKDILNNNDQILILVPQIFQIKKIRSIIIKKFPKIMITGVSNESKVTELRQSWLGIKNGNAQIIIGARSAIFAPFKNLKLIIIDQEENSGYISWDMTPKYDARKVAEQLARLYNAKLILGGDIPSVEYYYKLLPTKKFPANTAGRQVPSSKFQVVDMRDEIRKGNYSIFSDLLVEELKNTLNRNKKAILFINRRGSFRFAMCRDCGLIIKCKNCDAPMVCHTHNAKLGKNIDILKCHHCGFESTMPMRCGRCKSLRIKGFGIGTQRVEQEIKKLFPKIKVLRVDSDISKKFQVSSFKFQVLVATQMIFSLPRLKKVDLVGIISIDPMLNLPDFHSSEKTFQTILKLGNLGKQVLIQSYNPENSTIQAAVKRDCESFYKQEISEKKEFFYPPFSQLIKFIYRDKIGIQARNQALGLESLMKNSGLPADSFEILGPAPAFIPREKNKWVWQMVLKIKDKKIRNNLLRLVPSSWEIEVDPESVL